MAHINLFLNSPKISLDKKEHNYYEGGAYFGV